MDEAQLQFIADAREIVEKLDHDLEQLRTFRLHGPKRRELAARIFRRVHTLKGSASSLGLDVVSEVAHEFESVLDGVRLGRIAIDDSLLNLFEEATNLIAQALSRPVTGAINARPVIARLLAIAKSSSNQGRIANTLRATLPPEIALSLSEYDLQHAREAVREGTKLFVVSAAFRIEDFDQGFRELSKLLGQIGEVIATVPGESTGAEEIGFKLLYAADVVTDDIARRAAELGRIQITALRLEDAATGPEKLAQHPARTTSTDPPAAVRVELSQLDQVISDASELFRDTTNALSAVRGPDNREVVEAATLHLRRRFVELEERLIKLRLVPLADLLERTAARAGRIAARKLGKEIEFEIIGGDVEIDKMLADAIGEPLMHLVRNAVGHGIESPEERIAAGKSPIGKITLVAFSEGSRIHISVSDDGRGIDLERIATVANEHGISDHESLSPDQCLRLIFRPGFSTASEVSELSGRGIGLDVVDRAMERAGGEVRLQTGAGRGTTFLIVMPAALALVESVIVQSSDQFYAIERSHVVARRSLTPNEIERGQDQGNLDWEGDDLPFITLRKLLAQRPENGEQAAELIICEAGGDRLTNIGINRFALAVDKMIGEHEILVRTLGSNGARWTGVTGATELTDGNVALVLDLEALIKASGMVS
jgi:two-component system, chemotaxis family, sensor kinase CheA